MSKFLNASFQEKHGVQHNRGVYELFLLGKDITCGASARKRNFRIHPNLETKHKFHLERFHYYIKTGSLKNEGFKKFKLIKLSSADTI